MHYRQNVQIEGTVPVPLQVPAENLRTFVILEAFPPDISENNCIVEHKITERAVFEL